MSSYSHPPPQRLVPLLPGTAILDRGWGHAMSATWTGSSTPTGELLPVMQPGSRPAHPKARRRLRLRLAPVHPGQGLRCPAGHAAGRGQSNLGIYASGQAYEALLIRMRAHPLPEARAYADLILTELRKVIPSWVKRVDVDDRGEPTPAYLADNEAAMHAWPTTWWATRRHGPAGQPGGDPEVDLVDWDPDAEVKLIAAMLYPYSDQPEHRLQERVAAM